MYTKLTHLSPKWVIALLLSATSLHMKAQSSSKAMQTPYVPSLEDRYRIDYEIKGLENADPTLLSSIEPVLNELDAMRLQNEDIEINDDSGYTIIIYSIQKMLNNESMNPKFQNTNAIISK